MTRTRIAFLAVLAALLTAVPAEARVSIVGKKGGGPGEFLDPGSVELTQGGQVLVAEDGNFRGQKLPLGGAPLVTFGGYGTEPGKFSGASGYAPLGVAGGANGWMYIGDPGSGHISRFDSDGRYMDRWQASNRAIATDEDGRVYVASGSSITRYSAEGLEQRAWPVMHPGPVEPHDVSVRDGRVYVLAVHDYSYKALLVYDANGAKIEEWPSLPSQVQRIAAGPDGTVYTASWDRIDKYDTHGALLTSFSVACCDGDPYQQQPAPPGMWDQCKAPAPYSTSYGTEMMLSFADVAVSDAGVVFAADRSNDVVLRIEKTPHVRVGVGPQDYFNGRQTGQFIVFDASGSTTPFGPAPNRFEWDLDNDGDFELDTGAEATAVSAYATAGEHVIRVRATEPGGGSTVHNQRFTLNESKLKLWPYRFYTGQVSKIHAGADIPCSKVLKYEWDLDGDGVFEIDNGPKDPLEKVFEKVGKQRVSLRVTRPGGRVDVATGEFDIRQGPPPGPVGVSINDGAQFTKTPHVTVNPVWAPGSGQLFLANDGGFKQAVRFDVAPAIRWRLDSTGPERLPKTVYLRFDNLKGGPAYQDDIVLDETAPVVTDVTELGGQTASVSAEKRLSRVRIRARDNVSGLGRMQVTGSRKRPGKWRKFARRAAVRTRGPVFVRVRDRAHNRSRWRRARG